MKKLIGIAAFILTIGFIQAAEIDPIVGFIGPATNNSGAGTITIAAPGGGKRNCLTDFSITTSSNIVFSILDAGTTVYAIDITTTTFTVPPKSLPFAEDWYGTNSLCAGYNSALSFTMLNSTGSPGGYKLNYQGSIRGR